MATEAERANIEALHLVYEEWGRGNYKPRFEVYAPDMEWGWSEEFPDLPGIRSDPNDRSERLAEWLAPWEDWRVEAQDFLASGDFVVALCRYTGRGMESGVSVDTEGAHVWRFRDGKVVSLEIFSDRDRALEAAGLTP